MAIKRIFGSLGKHRSLLQLERPADGEAAVQEEEHGGNAAAESPASDGAAPAAAAAHGDSSAKPSGAAAMPGLEWNSSMANTVTEEELAALQITMADFESALPNVQPSAKREGFATIPNVSFKDIGALHGVRSELHLAIVEPIRKPERFAAFGLSPCAGVLLYGPPGCGKTLLAKAIAHESKANFISIKGPELLNKYVGESERAVRQVFSRARASAPCIIFFDELDALCPRRSGEATTSSERVVNQLLTEMDGLEPRLSVFIIAATNRPDLIDPAMLRPGRLDKLLYVPLPEKTERAEILKTITAQMPLAVGGRGAHTRQLMGAAAQRWSSGDANRQGDEGPRLDNTKCATLALRRSGTLSALVASALERAALLLHSSPAAGGAAAAPLHLLPPAVNPGAPYLGATRGEPPRLRSRAAVRAGLSLGALVTAAGAPTGPGGRRGRAPQVAHLHRAVSSVRHRVAVVHHQRVADPEALDTHSSTPAAKFRPGPARPPADSVCRWGWNAFSPHADPRSERRAPARTQSCSTQPGRWGDAGGELDACSGHGSRAEPGAWSRGGGLAHGLAGRARARWSPCRSSSATTRSRRRTACRLQA